jgi:hypothetical protein
MADQVEIRAIGATYAECCREADARAREFFGDDVLFERTSMTAYQSENDRTYCAYAEYEAIEIRKLGE